MCHLLPSTVKMKVLLCDAAGTPLWWPWDEESRASRLRRSATFPGTRCTCPPPWRTLSRLWGKCLNPCRHLTLRSMRSGSRSLGPAEKHQRASDLCLNVQLQRAWVVSGCDCVFIFNHWGDRWSSIALAYYTSLISCKSLNLKRWQGMTCFNESWNHETCSTCKTRSTVAVRKADSGDIQTFCCVIKCHKVSFLFNAACGFSHFEVVNSEHNTNKIFL